MLAETRRRTEILNHIESGVKRLFSFEIPSGGFSLFGHVPASLVLSSYGLQEFTDILTVYHSSQHSVGLFRDYHSRKRQPFVNSFNVQKSG